MACTLWERQRVDELWTAFGFILESDPQIIACRHVICFAVDVHFVCVVCYCEDDFVAPVVCLGKAHDKRV